MKYTKDNIVGLIFLGPSDPYTIISIDGNVVTMGYAPENKHYSASTFTNDLKVTLGYLNDGTWKPIRKKEMVYDIY